MDTPSSSTITKDLPLSESQDYAFLRDRGLELIAQLSGSTWTDYNAHDPGVTILEAVCYALTDLGQRASLLVPDLLVDPKTKDLKPRKTAIFPAHETLTNHPVTPNDWRKLLINRFGPSTSRKNLIRNAWVRQVGRKEQTGIMGLYEVAIAPASDRDSPVETQAILDYLNERRNLGELFIPVREVSPIRVSISAKVMIRQGVIPEEVLARMIALISDYFEKSPVVYTLQNLRDQGYTIEDIFEGPVVMNGYYKNNYIGKRLRRLTVEKLTKRLRKIPGIDSIDNIVLHRYDGDGKIRKEDLTKEQKVTVRFDQVLQFDDKDIENQITVYCQSIPMPYKRHSVLSKFYDLRNKQQTNLKNSLKTIHPMLFYPDGSYQGLDEYESIQTLFPPIYGIGDNPLPPGASILRQAQALQLKGYLAFFDHIMADYCARLGNLSNLFAIDPQPYTPPPVEDFDPEHPLYTTTHQQTHQQPLDYQNPRQRNRILSHLLARFGHSPQSFNPNLVETKEIIAYRIDLLERFLTDVNTISYFRGAAHSQPNLLEFAYVDTQADAYADDTIDSNSQPLLSGLERTLTVLLQNMLSVPKPGQEEKTPLISLRLIDHLMLLPPIDSQSFFLKTNDSGYPEADGKPYLSLLRKKEMVDLKATKPNCIMVRVPGQQQLVEQNFFSYQATLLISWPEKDKEEDPAFLALNEYVKQTLRRYAPAHLLINVRWLPGEEVTERAQQYDQLLNEQHQLLPSYADRSDSASPASQLIEFLRCPAVNQQPRHD